MDTLARTFSVALIAGVVLIGQGWSAVDGIQPVPNGLNSLPDRPTIEQISAVRELPSLLVPDGEPSEEGNAALASALKAYSNRESVSDVSALVEFVEGNPDSPWNISLLRGLAAIYYGQGRFSNVLDTLEEAWGLGKDSKDPAIRPIVDGVVADLARMNARVGRVARLEELQSEIGSREFLGAPQQMMTDSWESLWTMKNRPETAFRCGPFALGSIVQHVTGSINREIEQFVSTSNGTSLKQVADFAEKIGLNYQMARREPGAPVIVPAVVNWKVDHFGAILSRDGQGSVLRDPTFGAGEIWISDDVLDEESSGYFLIPEGPLPKGWTKVDSAEGARVWGKGQTTTTDPEITRKCDDKTDSCGGGPMAVASAHLAAVSLNMVDTPYYYTPRVGPAVRFTLTYNQRDSLQTYDYSNFGYQWTCNFMAYVKETGSQPSSGPQVFLAGGGGETYTNYSSGTRQYRLSPYSQTILTRNIDGNGNVTSYTREYSDGSREEYAKFTSSQAGAGRKIFLTKVYDPQGNFLTINYDSSFRITSVVDAVGHSTTFAYGVSGQPLLVSQISDSLGRIARFDYENGRLKKITDMIGITSIFTYNGNFITTLKTPYGTSLFAYGDITTDPLLGRTRWLELTDPNGGKERVEYNELGQSVTGMPDSIPVGDLPTYPLNNTDYYGFSNNNLKYRNTFYWSKKAMLQSPGVYAQATLYHWLHDSSNSTGGVIDYIKPPLETRIWRNYKNASQITQGTLSKPILIARKLDDGSSQVYQRKYNSRGSLIKEIDPVGRTTTYEYATNGIDLIAIYQQNPAGNSTDPVDSVPADKVAVLSNYNGQRQPQTSIDAAGRTTTFTYNAQGQILTRTVNRNGQNETTTWNYTNNYLMSVVGPVAGASVSFTYDSFDRVKTVTDSEGYMLTYSYDILDRVTRVSYPDGTYTQTIYDRLDPILERDRMGRWTRYTHDALRHLVSVKNPKGETTIYDWCKCGALDAIIDAAGNETTFVRDAQSRVTKKIYANTSEEIYTYDLAISRLKTFKDPKNQTKTYSYNLDNSLAGIVYSNAQYSTPNMSYGYSPVYPRLTSAARGATTTSFMYYPVTTGGTLGANQLWKVDGPLSGATDELVYIYDELGKVLSAKINGTGETVTYDALGRAATAVNPLGTFAYAYINQTPRVDTITRTGGQFAVDYSYYPNAQDQRLSEIKNMGPSSAVISKFNYTYDAAGDIRTWTQQQTGNPKIWTLGYNPARQLESAMVKDAVTSSALDTYSYSYDTAGNRKTWQKNELVTTGTFNNLNQMSSSAPGGQMIVEGTVSEPATVTVNGEHAVVDSNNKFRASVTMSQGVNQFPIVATDGSGNTTTRTAQVTVSQWTAGQTLHYDANGNLTWDGAHAYEWDAENRLIAINYGSPYIDRTEFGYDGLGRRNQIVEKTNGSITSTKNLVWIGGDIAEERNASNAVTRRFFSQGEQVGTTAYFYAKDHLGSIREMTDLLGGVYARYSYDPFGKRTKHSGAQDASFAFTGHYYHERSGLHLALYRAYDAELGRWLSRDPLGEDGGINLYGYVLNNPINLWDPLGLCESSPWLSWVPGQQSWDYAQTNFANGNYGMAAANFGSMIAEQSMFVLSLGTSSVANSGGRAAGSGAASAVSRQALAAERSALQKALAEDQAQLANGVRQAQRMQQGGSCPNPHGLGKEISEIIPQRIQAKQDRINAINRILNGQ